jgi:hypothetical protein
MRSGNLHFRQVASSYVVLGEEAVERGSLMDDSQRMTDENAFLQANRQQLAEFGPKQYAETGSRGIMAIDCTNQSGARTLYYLPEMALEASNLLDEASDIGRQVHSTLTSYDPENQLFVMFLYGGNASMYLLSVADLADDELAD